MTDIDYKRWTDYIERVFEYYKVCPSLVLDLGCGTGSFCIEMAKRGYEMVGIDISADMLTCAVDKSKREELDILFLNQDMTRFELYGTVDAIICLVDSINYVTNKKDLKRLFKLARNYLNPNGIFMFDINTAYKFENVLANNVFHCVEDDVAYIWENIYDRKRKICEFDLTFFIKEKQHYIRHDEVHFERAYSINEIKELIDPTGLKLTDVFDHLSFKPLLKNSERAFFICNKV